MMTQKHQYELMDVYVHVCVPFSYRLSVHDLTGHVSSCMTCPHALCLPSQAVLLDEVMRAGSRLQADHLLHFETRSLRDTRQLLSTVSIADTMQFIEQNPHPRCSVLCPALEVLSLAVLVAGLDCVSCHVMAVSPAHVNPFDLQLGFLGLPMPLHSAMWEV